MPSASFFSPLIVGILHTPTCLKKLAAEASDWRTLGIDLLEVRLDSLHELSIAIKWPLPTIATARDPKEGGSNNLSFTRRQELLESSLSWSAIIDIELASATESSSLIATARNHNRGVILSHHDFERTPEVKKLCELATRAHDAGASILKVATLTSSEEEVKRLLEFQQLSHPLPVATMGMGLLGKNSRQRLAAVGSALVYGWLYEPLSTIPASIQPKASELVKLIKQEKRNH